jgi:glycine dehydrogenase
MIEEGIIEITSIIHENGGQVYMDGANMNAQVGLTNPGNIGADVCHLNLHKTFAIPHGGGGPGDAIVAVSEKLVDFLPGKQVRLNGNKYETFHTPKCVGDFHRHLGNFAHKIRCYTYLKALGTQGIREMSATAVLSARYLQEKLKNLTPMLPIGADATPRMHEFIITLRDEDFKRIDAAGTPKANAIARIGKLFLDFGFHAPTVAFPEVYGLMIEPTESFTKDELDDFCEKVESIFQTFREFPQVLQTVPHFTPISRVNEVEANKTPIVSERLSIPLAPILADRLNVNKIRSMSNQDIMKMIVVAHEKEVAGARS